MCVPRTDRAIFYSKGREKGWSEDRIERAWAAHESQRAREDARILNEAPARLPLKVGDWVTPAAGESRFGCRGEILAIDGIEAWVRFAAGERSTYALRKLQRTTENPARSRIIWSERAP